VPCKSCNKIIYEREILDDLCVANYKYKKIFKKKRVGY